MLTRAILAFGSGRKVIVADPTYERFVAGARQSGAEVIPVPLRGNHAHDLDGMLARAETGTGLVYVCNPNNPTGSVTGRQDLEAFIAKLPASM